LKKREIEIWKDFEKWGVTCQNHIV
jgi:hypothetical protein